MDDCPKPLDSIKKRKSRFDEVDERLYDQLAESLTRYLPVQINSFSIPTVQSTQSAVTPMIIDGMLHIPATHPEFYERLDKALEKNFDYIRRKDNNEVSHIAAQGKSKNLMQKIMDSQSRKKAVSRPGIGSVMTNIIKATQPQTESNSIYISGLPLDITEEEIEILFGTQGKIKRIKIYTDSITKKPKGDALVTYHKSDSATGACVKYNELDIGENCVIQVTRAEFPHKTVKMTKDTSESKSKRDETELSDVCFLPTETYLSSVQGGDNVSVSVLVSSLPAESCAHLFPVVLVENAYDMNEYTQQNQAYLNDIEADMLLECCQHGNVKVLLMLTPKNCQDSRLWGGMAVSYETARGAQECVQSLQSRWFDGRELRCRHINNPSPEPFETVSTKADNQAYLQLESTASNELLCISIENGAKSQEDLTKEIEDDTDAFLSSLL